MSILQTLVQSMISLPGAIGSAIVDIESGQTLARTGRITAEVIEIAGTANARLLRFKMSMVTDQYHRNVEDILITLTDEYHLIRLVHCPGRKSRQFLYLVLDRAMANLAFSRIKLTAIEEKLTLHDSDSRSLQIECDHVLDGDSIRTNNEQAISYTREGNPVEGESDEDLPPFMRTDVALKLLGVSLEEIKSSHRLANQQIESAIK